ncbi:MAG: hypothetical protein ACLGIA_13415 [Actinomycetes bacterium]
MRWSAGGAPVQGPWFRAHPRATVAVAAALFVAVFVLRLSVGTVTDVVSMLFTLPIALLAVAFGLRAGIAAGLVGVALVVAWDVLADAGISPVGWMSRAVPLLLLGGLLGDAADRLRASEAHRRHLVAAAERHRDAVEINDTVVQGITAAKWALEAGNVEGGLEILSDTLSTSQRLVSDLLRNSTTDDGDVYRSAPRQIGSPSE